MINFRDCYYAIIQLSWHLRCGRFLFQIFHISRNTEILIFSKNREKNSTTWKMLKTLILYKNDAKKIKKLVKKRLAHKIIKKPFFLSKWNKFVNCSKNIQIFFRIFGCSSEKPIPLILLKSRMLTYFGTLNTNMTMKIGANDIFKVKRTKNPVFQQFFKIIMNAIVIGTKKGWIAVCCSLL